MRRRPRPPRYLPAVLLVGTVVLGSCGSQGAGAINQDRAVIGIVRSVPDEEHGAFLDGLRRQGWNPGQQVRVLPADPATVQDDAEEVRAAVAAWADEDLDLLIAYSTPHAEALAAEAPDTPVLFVVNDPVASGLVAEGGSPGGQLSGLTFHVPADRTLDLAHRALGGLTHVGYLRPREDPAIAGHRATVQRAARTAGIDFTEAAFADPADVADAVDRLVEAGVDAVYLASSNSTFRALDEVEAELARRGLPAVANIDLAEFAVVVLTPDRAEMRRQLARQAARVLGGAPIASVPVEDPRKFQLIINATAADEIGLPALDPEVLRQADLVR